MSPPTAATLRVLDLPGTYSLNPTTLDEAITRDVLLGRVADAPAPELVVCVVDAVHLPIGLRLALEVKRLGLPMVLALNRMDVARRRNVQIDVARLSAELGVPVLPTVAVKRGGADALIEAIEPARWTANRSVSAPAWQEATAEDAEQTQSDLRGVLAAVGYSRAAGKPVVRAHRRAAAASGGRPGGARGRDVPDVPGGVQLGGSAHGLDRRRHGAARRLHRREPAGGTAVEPARRTA